MLFGRRSRDAERPRPDWEAVWQGDSEPAANVVAGSLQADGIGARVQGGRMVSLGLPAGAPGGLWAVFTPAADAGRARDLLRQSGDSANIVAAPGEDSGGLQAATLKFAFVAILAVAIFALLMTLRG